MKLKGKLPKTDQLEAKMNQIYLKALLSLRSAILQRAQTPDMAAKLAEIEAAIEKECNGK